MADSHARQLLRWIDDRFPLGELYNKHLKKYDVPKNFNFRYVFDFLALTVLAIQIATGIRDRAGDASTR